MERAAGIKGLGAAMLPGYPVERSQDPAYRYFTYALSRPAEQFPQVMRLPRAGH